MPDLRPVRGTRDFLPEDSRLRRHVETTAEQVAAACGYGEVATPIFEFTEVFARTLGDTSDVVTKEDVHLRRPRRRNHHAQAGEHRRHRPRLHLQQADAAAAAARLLPRADVSLRAAAEGRLRQFHQVGVELLGVADPLGDVEVIALAYEFLAALGLTETTALELNSLGDGESRTAYRAVLVEYLRQHHGALSEDSRVRLERNPLRILDSKDEGDRRIVAKAPLLVDHLNEASRTVFARTLAGLEALAIPYTHNPRLVRGLDYYCHTAFEFTTQALGAQGTVLAGGRYDGLVQQMGGPATPGTGWAAGVERLMDLVVAPAPAPRPVVVIALGAEQQLPVMTLAKRLRVPGQVVLFAFGGNLGKQMKWTNRVNARRAVIIGSEELARHVATVRDMDTGTQEEVSLAYLDEHLALLA